VKPQFGQHGKSVVAVIAGSTVDDVDMIVFLGGSVMVMVVDMAQCIVYLWKRNMKLDADRAVLKIQSLGV
jgi:hypothetical protein